MLYCSAVNREEGAEVSRKAMTLRLGQDQAKELEAIARAEGTSVSDAVRDAIAEHIERRRRDPEFKARLQRIMEEDRAILKRLAG